MEVKTRLRWVRTLGAGVLCASSVTAPAASLFLFGEAKAQTTQEQDAGSLGPLLVAPRLAGRPTVDGAREVAPLDDIKPAGTLGPAGDAGTSDPAASAIPMSSESSRQFQEIISQGKSSRRVEAPTSPLAVPLGAVHGAASPVHPTLEAGSEPEINLATEPTPGFEEETLAPESSAPQQELSPELERLRERMKNCLEYYSQRPESASERSPWGVMHALIAYGADTELLVGSRRVNAIGWLCWNGACRGQQLLYVENNRIAARVGTAGMQGHAGQFLAMLAQSRVRPETSMRVQGREFTVADFIEYEKKTCEPKTELTFKLIALAYYLESDETWVDDRGRTWSIPRLIQEELAQPIVGAACGGTHRLTGLSYSLRMRQRDNKPLDGQWERARIFIDDYHDYTLRLQNADGSFSTSWFAGRGDWGDVARRVETTGHIFEWLAFSLPKERLTDPQVVRAATYLTETMIQQRHAKLEIGPKGHALHGLNIYLDRAFQTRPEYITPEVARRRTEGQR